MSDFFDDENLTEEQQGTNLPAVNTATLNQESLALINKIIEESDVDKVKDLTYLFNINQNKKTIARIDKLSALQDLLVAQFSKRIAERPDEISNQEIMNAMKIVQDIIERGQDMVIGTQEAPLIQINQQTNSVNVDNSALTGLNRDSREKIKNIISSVVSQIGKVATEQVPTTDGEPIVITPEDTDE